MSPSLSGEDKRSLHKVALLSAVLRNVNATISIQQVHTLILVALHEGSSVTEIARMSGFKLPTVSRNLLDLGMRNRKREPGYGLVETEVDPMELRKKSVTLTPKGREVIRQIVNVMYG